MTPQEPSILQLAIQGKLVEQREEEGTGEELLEKILVEKGAGNLTRRRGERGGKAGTTETTGTSGTRLRQGLGGQAGASLACPVRSGCPVRPADLFSKNSSAPSAPPREEIPPTDAPFDIPEGWVWVGIETAVDIVPSKQYQILESEVCQEGKIPVISQSQAYSIKYLFHVLKFHSMGLSKIGGYSRHYKYLKNKLIPLTPFAEQKRIVAKLEELLPLCERLK